MYYGKMMRKALSVVLSAAMLFTSASVPTVRADESPGVNTTPGIMVPGEENGLLTKAVSGNDAAAILNTPKAGTVVTDPKTIKAGEVLQFDFGKKNIPTDYLGVGGTALENSTEGYGLKESTEKDQIGPKGSFTFTDTDSDLKTVCLDLVRRPNELEFLVEVPNGIYNVTVYAHDLGNGWSEDLFVNGDSIGSHTKTSSSGTGTIADATHQATNVVVTGNTGLSIKGTSKDTQGFLNGVIIECVSIAAAENYTIKYNTNGALGNVPQDLPATTTQAANLDDGSGLSKTGYRFVGWAASADAKTGSLVYNYKQNDAKDGVVTLYAIWAKEYELVYNSNGGDANTKVPTDTKKYIVGEEITLDTTVKPTKKGSTFLGWGVAANAESAVTKLTVAETNILADKIQVYAVWQAEGVVNLKFDFGVKGTAEGFINISNEMYDASKGYGFTKSVTFKNDKGTNVPGTVNPTDENIFDACRDYTYTADADGLVFQVDVPAGTYSVSVYAGIGGDITSKIKVNDKDLGETPTTKPSNEADILKSTIITLDKAGSITVSSTGSTARNMLNALIIKTSEVSAFSAPENVRVNSTATSVTLTWDAVQNATHYAIFRHSPSGDDAHSDTYNQDFLQIGSTDTTSFTDPVLTDKV